MERRAYFQSFQAAIRCWRWARQHSNYVHFCDVKGGHKVVWHQS